MYKASKILIILLIFALSLPLFTTVIAQEGMTATTTAQLNVRAAPDRNAERLGVLDQGVTVQVQGRNAAGDWVLVQTPDGALRGWAAAAYLSGFDLNSLPVIEMTVAAPNPTVSAPVPSGAPINLSRAVINRSRQIYQRGQRLGNLPNVFIQFGDSNTAAGDFHPNFWGFMCAVSGGIHAYELGGLGYLQDTINYFDQTGSFCTPNVTAQGGFNTLSVLDPTWTPAFPQCEPPETLLDCEVRIKRPSVALLYIGWLDLLSFTLDESRANYRQIIERLSSKGVIPVIITFPFAEGHSEADRALAYNAMLRNLASSYRIPLIDFQSAVFGYPNHGVRPGDDYHLYYRSDGVISFSGDQNTFAYTMRYLLTLQMLHDLVMGVYTR